MQIKVRLVVTLMGITLYCGAVSVEDKSKLKVVLGAYNESENSTFDAYDNSTHPDEPDLDDAKRDYKHMLVQLYLMDIHETVHSTCSGAIISDDYVITSGSCMRDATKESMVKVCYDGVNNHPSTCNISIYAIQIVFPANEWYNNMAFVKVNGSELNVTVAYAYWEKADVTDCGMYGISMQNTLVDIRVDVRRNCKYGYYCIDDPSGWSCDMNLGSMLICAGTLRGIYVDKYSQSCQYHNDEDSMQHHVENSPDDDGEHEHIQMDHYPLLFFVSFEQYSQLIGNVIWT